MGVKKFNYLGRFTPGFKRSDSLQPPFLKESPSTVSSCRCNICVINFAGWNFAKITDVMVHRVHNGQALQDAKNTAELVFSNGCRNPSYRPLAPYNPWRDSRYKSNSAWNFFRLGT